MDIYGTGVLLLIVVVSETLGFLQYAQVNFPEQATYRDCDLCSVMFKRKRKAVSGDNKCSPGRVCRAVGLPDQPAQPQCLDASTLSPAFLTPFCPRGSGDTAVLADGSMMRCTENDDCPLDFVCSFTGTETEGACCRDVTRCQKLGNCPASASSCGSDNACVSDSECPGDAKCCYYPSCQGARCIMPFFTGR